MRIANPKTLEFQVVRTSLLPGLLKTLRENRSHALPVRVFEAADVVLQDAAAERRARNVRRAAALWCNKAAGFEVVHGLLDRAMQMLEVPRVAPKEADRRWGYYIRERDGACFLPLLPFPHSPFLRAPHTRYFTPPIPAAQPSEH